MKRLLTSSLKAAPTVTLNERRLRWVLTSRSFAELDRPVKVDAAGRVIEGLERVEARKRLGLIYTNVE